MQKLQMEGIVVQVIPFKDYDRIVSLFTPEEGLIKLFFKGALRSKNGKGYGLEPLSLIEVVCRAGKGDLYTCVESYVLDPHLSLRAGLPLLNAACDMLHAITATQLPGKPAPDLFKLLLAYFLRLPAMPNPATLASSFRMKTLRCEGLFNPQMHCTRCGIELQDESYYEKSQSFCSSHASPEALLSFSSAERDLLLLLAFCRDFNLMREISVDEEFSSKICKLFEQSIHLL